MRTIEVDLTAHGLSARAGLVAFDPERREAFATGELLAAEVAGQTLRLVALRAAPGVLWADRSWTVSPGGAALVVDVEAAPVDAGRLWIYAPGAALVSIDGGKVDAATTPGEPGILRVDLPDGAAHQVRVEL
jgi:hypothetical protein